MSFTSLVFILFSALFFIGWKAAKNNRQIRWTWLALASFFFYGWWDWRFLFLLFFTGLVDFALALVIDKAGTQKSRKFFLCVSLICNLSVLAAFKYAVFIVGNVEWLLSLLGPKPTLLPYVPSAFLVLPIGISFYTFESVSYTIDVYRREIKPTNNLIKFFAFLSMFPRLVAGPIERPANLLPQMSENKEPSAEMLWKGFFLIVTGYFKKLVISDHLANYVNEGFANAEPLSGISWWLVMFAFSLQIYCDFSGYSDIARGLANFMGYDFKLNFNSPYVSRGFSDFWTRWHISLSSWFRDYLYIPLGGSRKSETRTHINLWITMLVSGLWHGANWNFVMWGGGHALMLSIERWTQWPKRLTRLGALGSWIVIGVTFILATLLWVFFRAPNFEKAVEVAKAMLSLAPGAQFVSVKCLVLIVLGLLPQWAHHYSGVERFEALKPTLWVRVALVLMIVLCIFARGPGSTFIYFQF